MKIYEIQTKYVAKGTTESKAFGTAADIFNYMQDAFDARPDQEQLWVIPCNGANKPIGRYMATLGLANQSLVHAREVFRVAVREGAVSIAIVHNHPSGQLIESPEDVNATRKLVEAGKLLDIPVMDHVIMADVGYRSIRASHPELF